MEEFDEEEAYKVALLELSSNNTRPGVWAKAFALSDGDERKSQALYIKLRVQQERNLIQQNLDELTSTNNLKQQLQRQHFDSIIEGLLQSGHKIRRTHTGWKIREPLGGQVNLSSDQALLDYSEGRIIQKKNRTTAPNRLSDSKSDTPPLAKLEEYSQNKSDDSKKLQPEATSGVRGWLLVLIIGMVLLGPLLGAGRINSEFMGAERIYPTLANSASWSAYKSASWLTFLVAASISVIGGLSLLKDRNPAAVNRAKWCLWLSGPLASIVIGVLIPSATFSEAHATEFIGGLIASVVITSIWTLYLVRSKRVASTYRL